VPETHHLVRDCHDGVVRMDMEAKPLLLFSNRVSSKVRSSYQLKARRTMSQHRKAVCSGRNGATESAGRRKEAKKRRQGLKPRESGVLTLLGINRATLRATADILRLLYKLEDRLESDGAEEGTRRSEFDFLCTREILSLPLDQ
jgi:hypothetical protein